MTDKRHNLSSTVNEFSAKLATGSRHICILLGAGASVGAGLPDLAKLTERVRERLDPTQKRHLETMFKGRNLEQALSRIRRIASILNEGGEVDGIDKESAVQLDKDICHAVIEAIRNPSNRSAFNQLGLWASRADYRRPVEIFTTNYDLLIEEGLEACGAAFFDGFVGTLQGSFRHDLVEEEADPRRVPPSFVRLWKLHGSSNWATIKEGGKSRIVRLGVHAPSDATVAIYPSDEKYDESRRVPFVAMMDRFRRSLCEAETILIVAGYSFGDQHINEMIFDAARRRPRSEIVAFCYSTVPDILRSEALAIRNITVFGSTEGVIGGVAAAWDAELTEVGISTDNKCVLGDFRNLATFLNKQHQPQLGIQ
jgi:SIR2-like domain